MDGRLDTQTMLQVRRMVAVSKNLKIPPLRQISSATSRIQSASPPFPIAATCPSPMCACAETPVGLDIDRKRDLNGSMAPYKQQVVISTGKSDWTSRIEDDGQGTPWGDLARKLKAMLGRGGKYSDVRRYVLPLCYIGRPKTTSMWYIAAAARTDRCICEHSPSTTS